MSHWFLSRNSNTFMRKCNLLNNIKIVNHPCFSTKLRVKFLAANPQYSRIRFIFVNNSHVVYKVVCNLLTKMRLKRSFKKRRIWLYLNAGIQIEMVISLHLLLAFSRFFLSSTYFENICLRRKCMCLLYHVHHVKVKLGFVL